MTHERSWLIVIFLVLVAIIVIVSVIALSSSDQRIGGVGEIAATLHTNGRQPLPLIFSTGTSKSNIVSAMRKWWDQQPGLHPVSTVFLPLSAAVKAKLQDVESSLSLVNSVSEWNNEVNSETLTFLQHNGRIVKLSPTRTCCAWEPSRTFLEDVATRMPLPFGFGQNLTGGVSFAVSSQFENEAMSFLSSMLPPDTCIHFMIVSGSPDIDTTGHYKTFQQLNENLLGNNMASWNQSPVAATYLDLATLVKGAAKVPAHYKQDAEPIGLVEVSGISPQTIGFIKAGSRTSSQCS
jgi:hypothetical protein